MARVTRGFKARRRRNRLLKLASGFQGGRGRLFKVASEAVDRSLAYAYRDRKAKKRDFRKLWVTRINAATREHGMSYSVFMGKLKAQNILLNRKSLGELAFVDPDGFAAVVKAAQ